MQKSFSDRVLAGVCGGLAAALHINAWLVRLVFVVLSLLSLGAFAVLYLLLWWVVPQESYVGTRRRRRRIAVFFLLILTAFVGVAWAGRDLGFMRAPPRAPGGPRARPPAPPPRGGPRPRGAAAPGGTTPRPCPRRRRPEGR